MKKFNLIVRISTILTVTILLFSACEKEEIAPTEPATNVSLKSSGSILYSKYGVNLNNVYGDKNAKSDWQSFLTYNSDLNTALNHLESNITNFKIYRVGFSRNMANDDADLDQWAESLKVLKSNWNRMIICLWGQGEISNASGDAAIWQKVIDKLDSKGVLDYVYGWELNNEPDGNSSNLATYYTNVWNGISNWRGKKIILDGTNYAQNFWSGLVSGTSSISNKVWAVHCYPKFISTKNRENESVQWWKDKFISKWNNDLSGVGSNYIVTELGTSDRNVTNPSTVEEKREAGFVQAAEQLFGGSTTVFWYSGYYGSAIGLINPYNGKVKTNNKNNLNTVFY